ncbi:MAG: hypothetical protein DRR11_01355 [Gammaproteobacteria bacterium]|nr:MAG: hypothetical protein DRR11_01355 [Gammaproteobacteria bacterium]
MPLPTDPAPHGDPIKQKSLRGAQRRGNLQQVTATQNEALRQRQKIATPSRLAMTSVLSDFTPTQAKPCAAPLTPPHTETQ